MKSDEILAERLGFTSECLPDHKGTSCPSYSLRELTGSAEHYGTTLKVHDCVKCWLNWARKKAEENKK